MIRLIDLSPAWIDYQDRHGLGVAYNCILSHCDWRLWTLFKNPLDGGPAWPGNSRSLILEVFPGERSQKWPGYKIVGCGTCRWERSGETFETLTLSPSVNAHECGHKTLTNGIFQ